MVSDVARWLSVVASRLLSMSVTVDLPAEALRRIEAEAARRSVGIDVVIAELAETLPAEGANEPAGGGHRFGFVGVAASGDGTLSERYKAIRRKDFGS